VESVTDGWWLSLYRIRKDGERDRREFGLSSAARYWQLIERA
jgi:hypothetical protein